MLKIRRSRDRLIFNMRIPTPGKDGLYIETEPRSHITLTSHGRRGVPNHRPLYCLLSILFRVTFQESKLRGTFPL